MGLLDAVWNLGCNTFDLAHVYGQKVETLFGKWLSTRMSTSDDDTSEGASRSIGGVGGGGGGGGSGSGKFLRNGRIRRSDLYLIGKGGHPFLSSKDAARLSSLDLAKDLDESLNRIKIHYFDFYLLYVSHITSACF